MLSREGKEIIPLDCNLRMAMPEGALCRDCAHAIDICKSLKKRILRGVDGRNVIYYCSGYDKYPADQTKLNGELEHGVERN